VARLARPGGNVTGLSTQLSEAAGKRVELLREVVTAEGSSVMRVQSSLSLALVVAASLSTSNPLGTGSTAATPRGGSGW
jgi:hypothetical protein